MRALIVAFLAIAAGPSWGAETQITDGGTLMLNGTIYRLAGIDAPQTDQTCLDDKGSKWTCGIEARDRLQAHVGKHEVRCDDRGADGLFRRRRMGECWVEGERISLNQWMVREGLALNLDRSGKSRFKADSENAKANKMGLWKGCFIAPDTLRRFTISTATLLGAACPQPGNWPARQTLFPDNPVMPPGCTIKGRIAMRSQLAGYVGIYHLPSCRSYARTRQAHRWFCSEDEAKAAGFRKSYTC